MLFVIPWLDSVLVGTTDTDFDGDIDNPVVDATDRTYVLDALNSVFDLDLDESHIAGAYAGLRPLVKGKAGADRRPLPAAFRIRRRSLGDRYHRREADDVETDGRGRGRQDRGRSRCAALEDRAHQARDQRPPGPQPGPRPASGTIRAPRRHRAIAGPVVRRSGSQRPRRRGNDGNHGPVDVPVIRSWPQKRSTRPAPRWRCG